MEIRAAGRDFIRPRVPAQTAGMDAAFADGFPGA
jgi:hypothetical protein